LENDPVTFNGRSAMENEHKNEPTPAQIATKAIEDALGDHNFTGQLVFEVVRGKVIERRKIRESDYPTR
jgi:hypothetical protein